MNKGHEKQKGDDLSSACTEGQDIFETIFQLADDIIVYVDTQGRILDVNRKTEHILGYKPEELKGRGFSRLNILSQKDALKILKLFGDVVKKGDRESIHTEVPHIMALEIRHKNGNPVFVEASTTTIRESGKLKGFVSVIRDITERRKAEEKQREIGRRFRNIFYNCPIGVYRTTPDGRILAGNPVLVRMLGFSSFEELAARNLEEKGFEPDYPRSEFKEMMESNDQVQGLETAWIKQDGTTIFVRENSKAVRDHNGTILYYDGTVEDITEYKWTEEALRLSHDLLQAAYRYKRTDELLKESVAAIKSFSRCSAVGIRLLDQEGNIPYQAYDGFSQEFYETESPLSIKLDQCMCITVIKGETNPSLPFITKGGSFYMNETTRFLATISEDDKGKTRNVCNETGYESVALIPVRIDQQILGLIHLADQRENKVPLKSVELLEKAGLQIGEAIRRIRVEKALKKSREKLDIALEKTGISVWDWKVKTGAISFDDHWARMLGYEPGEIVFDFDWWKRSVHPDSFPVFEEALKAYLEGKQEQYELEYRMQNKSGEWIWIWARGICSERDEKGDPERFIGTHRDITKRKRAEVQARLANERLQYLLSASPAVIYSAKPSDDYKATFISENVSQIVGYKPREFVENPRFWIDRVHPDDLQKVHDMVLRLFDNSHVVYEYRFKHRNGNYIWVRDEMKLVRDEKGNPIEIVGYWADITERKQAEETLRESEEKYRLLFENANDAIYLHEVSQEGPRKIFAANEAACRMLGYTQEELLRMTISDIDVPEQMEKIPAILDRLFEEGYAIFETEHVRKDRSKVQVLVSIRTFDLHGTMVMLSIVRDITERKRAEEEKNKLLHDLGERVKELNLLFEIERFLNSPDVSLDDMYQKTADLMPAAWKYPEIACARITVEGTEYTSADFQETKWKLRSKIVVHEKEIGNVELCYREEKPNADADPFLKEEKTLIGLISERLGETTEHRRVEVALQEERNKLKSIVESIEYGLTIHDRDYSIIYQNEALIEQVGEHLGEKCYWAYEHRGQICDGCPVQLAWEDGNSHTSERKVIMPSGEIAFWENTASPIRNAKGEIIACLEITRNITERKRTEEALKRSEANLREAQRIAHMGSWSLDLSNNKISLSEEMIGIYKLPQNDRSGELAFEVWEKYIHPEDKKKVQTAFENALADERPYDIEFKIFRSDNKIRTLHALGGVVKDETGKPVRMIGTGLDVTERRLAEKELRESEQKYRDLVENINDVIYSVDQRGIITYISPVVESITGYKPVETIGQNYSEFVHPEDLPEVIRSFEATKSGRLFPVEYRIFRKDGQEIWIRTFSRPVFKEGKYRGLRGVMTDVTERKRLLQQLIQSEKAAAVGTLAYGIAHEFNNILAGIMANAEYGASIENMQQIRKCFKVIVENTQRGSSITNSLLTVAGERKGKKQIANITQPLRNILSFSRRELEKANIKIVDDLKPIPEILCDPGQFSEVFLNMINNARDAMLPQGGTLMIRLDHYLGNIRIIFKDTGCGIPDEIKDRIFDPFVTTKGALGGSDVPGTGLGLYLTLGIVDSYGGQIDVLSYVGRGTTFTILIPVSKNLPSEPMLGIDTAAPEDIPEKLNILLIDDEEVICRALTKYLESKGHKVKASMEALEGLEQFQKDKYDVVLSDITMPGMDGIELIKEMKKSDAEVKIIAITGHVHRDKLEQARKAGAKEVLIKPFKSVELYSTIVRLYQDETKEEEKVE